MSRGQTTRRRILDAALRLLAERGYHGAGMEQIARSAGVTRQALYLHFPSKADLLVAVAQHGDELAGIPELLGPIFEAKTPRQILDAGVAVYAAIQPRIYDIARVVRDARHTDPAAEAAWQDRMRFRRANIHHDMERLRAENALARGWTVDDATDFVAGLLSLSTYEELVIERGWPIERFVEILRRVLRQTLLATPDRTRARTRSG